MTKVAEVTVGSGGAASIEFTGIAGTGKDLLILISSRNTGANGLYLTINGDTTASRYTYRVLFGSGSSVGSINGSNLTGEGAYIAEPNRNTYTANTFDNTSIYIANYAVAAAKSISVDSVAENNATAADQSINAVSYNQTTAITSLLLRYAGTNNFVQHTTASLYIVS